MKYDLQFFAEEGIGAEETDLAAQLETVNEGVTTEVAEGSTSHEGAQTSPEATEGFDKNAFAAQVRRETEAKWQKKIDAIDATFAEKFGSYTNPETGKHIASYADYLEALEAEKRVEARAEFESKGIDPASLDRYIANSPEMRQARQMIDELNAQRVQQAIDEDIAALNKMDPNITSLETVPPEVLQVASANNITLVNAYKIANFGKTSAQQASAIRQNTINQISGKAHFAPVNGVAQNTNEVEIPADQLKTWEEYYPGLSYNELRKKYNRTIK